MVCPVRKKYRHLHYQMQASVSALLRLLYIILSLQELYIILPQQTFFHSIYIIYIIAYDPHTGKVHDLIDRLYLFGPSLSLYFIHNALDALDTALHVMDRIIIISDAVFVIQYFQLSADLFYGRLISHPQITENFYDLLGVVYRNTHVRGDHILIYNKLLFLLQYHDQSPLYLVYHIFLWIR